MARSRLSQLAEPDDRAALDEMIAGGSALTNPGQRPNEDTRRVLPSSEMMAEFQTADVPEPDVDPAEGGRAPQDEDDEDDDDDTMDLTQYADADREDRETLEGVASMVDSSEGMIPNYDPTELGSNDEDDALEDVEGAPTVDEEDGDRHFQYANQLVPPTTQEEDALVDEGVATARGSTPTDGMRNAFVRVGRHPMLPLEPVPRGARFPPVPPPYGAGVGRRGNEEREDEMEMENSPPYRGVTANMDESFRPENNDNDDERFGEWRQQDRPMQDDYAKTLGEKTIIIIIIII